MVVVLRAQSLKFVNEPQGDTKQQRDQRPRQTTRKKKQDHSNAKGPQRGLKRNPKI